MDFDLELLGFVQGRAGQAARPGREGRPDRSRRGARAARRGDHAAGRPVDPRRPPAALRRQQQARGRRPAAGRRRDPPGEHRPAVQREGRAAQQQRHRRRATVRSPTTTTSSSTWPGTRRSRNRRTGRCGPRTGRWPTTSSRDEAFDRHAARLVRQHGPRAGARPRVLHLGRLRQLRQLSAGAEGQQAVLLPRRSSGTRSIRC